jgi:hypothetical protein
LGLSEILLCSVKTGSGVKDLWTQILSRTEEEYSGGSQPGSIGGR